MRTAQTVALTIVRLTGIFQVAVGLALWFGYGYQLLQVHMGVGLAFVVAMWVLAALSFPTHGARVLALLVAGWGALVLALGIGQMRLLIGPFHWVVEGAHFLVGFIGMVLAVRLGNRLRKGHAPAYARTSP